MMQVGRRVVAHRLEVVRLENTQHLQRRDALAVRRQLPHSVPVEGNREWLHPISPMSAEILERQETAQLPHAIDNPAPQLAAIEDARTLRGHQPERLREV